ncbi:MAG: hypothetical protein ACOYY2_03975 [Actinomycetota bacterium]
MRLAVADPPYLGRAERWYGPTGRGSGGGLHRADAHPAASEWDRLERHHALVDELVAGFDGWALFTGAANLRVILPHCPDDVLVASWVVTNAVPSGSRILAGWEPVLVYVPAARRGRASSGLVVRSAHVAAAPRRGFTGAKPASVCRWVLDLLGYVPEDDELVDLFPGSGAVTTEAAHLTLL